MLIWHLPLIATFALSAATYGIATLVNMTFTTCLRQQLLPNWNVNLPLSATMKDTTMFDIEHYKKPRDWAQIALWVVSLTAIVVVLLDLFIWRP
jgi:hypothetical protein